MNVESVSKPVGFEASLVRLEEIVRALEKGDASLEGALALFEEGTRLAKICAELLDRAEQTVTLLVRGEGADEDPSEEPFDAQN